MKIKKCILLRFLAPISIFLMIAMHLAQAERLPTISGDSGSWGTVLNNFMLKDHTQNGTHRNITIGGNLVITNAANNVSLIFNSSTGRLGIGTTAPAITLDIKGKANFTGNFSIMNASDTILFVDNTSGRIGIGTTSPGELLHIDGNGVNLKIRSASGIGGQGIGYIVERSRGTQDVPTAIQSDDMIASFASRGYDGTSFTTQAAMRSFASQNWISAAKGTYLTFLTTPNGDTTLTERVRVDNIGNVGIGTTAPLSLLHLNKSDTENKSVTNILTLDHVLNNPVNSTGGVGVSILFRASDNASQTYNIGNISAVLYNSTNGSQLGALTFSTSGPDNGDGSNGHLLERLRIDGNGRVGIGTTSPTARLHSQISGNGTALILQTTGLDPLQNIALDFMQGTNLVMGKINSTGESSGNVGMGFYTLNSNILAERIRISGSGNVGIGTTAPLSLLHLNKNDTDNNSVTNILTLDHVLNNPINSTGGVGVSILFRASDNASQTYNIANISSVLYNSTNGSQLGALTFSTSGADTGDNSFGHLNERMRIDGNGRVGIGTTFPNAKLVVMGGANISGGLNVSAGNVLLATESGKVGIGMIRPAQTLTVQGTFNVTAQSTRDVDILVNENGAINITGNLTMGNKFNPTNLTMYSPNGVLWHCGVDNTGTFSCS